MYLNEESADNAQDISEHFADHYSSVFKSPSKKFFQRGPKVFLLVILLSFMSLVMKFKRSSIL